MCTKLKNVASAINNKCFVQSAHDVHEFQVDDLALPVGTYADNNEQ